MNKLRKTVFRIVENSTVLVDDLFNKNRYRKFYLHVVSKMLWGEGDDNGETVANDEQPFYTFK